MLKYAPLIVIVGTLFAVATGADNEIDPKIYSPLADTVWTVGTRYQILWNSSFRLPDDLYYSTYTRLTIQLYQQRTRKSVFIMTIAKDYPFSMGYIYWTVPRNSSSSGSDSISIGAPAEEAKYFLKIYPSFFDWPRSCKGCTDSVPRSAYFTILPNECTDFSCINGGEAGPSAVTGTNDPFSAYINSLKSVAVGVGVVALLFFTVAFFVYTKKGWKSWEQYRSRKNGMQYKYRPPAIGNIRNATTNSNLFSTFSTGSTLESTGGTHIDGFDSSYRPPGSSFLDMGFGSPQTDEEFLEPETGFAAPPHPSRSSSIALPHHAQIPTLRDPSRFEIPPRRPPRPYTPPPESRSGAGSSSNSRVDGMIIRPPPAAHLRPGNASNGEETSLSNSIINETEAALVGHTFRNALRVNYENEQQENRRKSMASNSDLNDSNKQLTITEHDFLPPDLADELVNSCSPVLSQLAAVVEK